MQIPESKTPDTRGRYLRLVTFVPLTAGRILALLSLVATALQGQTRPSRLDATTLRRQLDSIVRVSLTDIPLAGASVLVLRGEDTLLAVAHGHADLENMVRAGLSTVYPIGSITKQLTAAAILQQVERGKISLDDDVAKYVPEYSSRGKRVTVRQLLNHTSGIRDLNDLGDPFFRVLPVHLSQKDVLALVRDEPFDFEPGTRWHYNNTGYFLLGVILERVTGMTYAAYISEQVAGPAGLIATGSCDGRRLIRHRARGYNAVGTDFINGPYLSGTTAFSAAGLCSTAGDLATWARALRTGKVISRRSYETMTTPEGSAARASPPYGFGVWVIESGGRRYLSRLGLFGGFNGVLSEVPSDSLTIVVLTNTSGYGASTLGGRLGSAILGTPAPKVDRAARLTVPRGRPLTRSERLRYVGRYQVRAVGEDSSMTTGVVTLEVFDENGRLTAQLTGDPPETLTRVGEHRFVATTRPDTRFTFELRADGTASVMVGGPDGTFKGIRNR